MINPSLTMADAEEATRRNNQGVALLQEQSYGPATKELFAGLNLVKQLLSAKDNDDEDEEGEPMETDEVESDCLQFAPPPQGPALSAKGELFAFQCPLQVRTLQLGTLSQHHSYHVKLSFVLLYNLALAHHLSALEGQLTPSSKKLRKALSLYELAYTVQVTEEMPLSVLQTMAIVNNLGHVHALLGSSVQSALYFQQLLSTILLVNDCGHSGRVPTVPQMDGFVRNVLPLMLQRGNESAPAA